MMTIFYKAITIMMDRTSKQPQEMWLPAMATELDILIKPKDLSKQEQE